MAKRAKAEGEAAGDGKAKGFDPKRVPAIVGRIEASQSEIDAIMSEAADNAAPHREEIDKIKKEAHEKYNIPRRELNTLIAERKYQAKATNFRLGLNNTQKENFDQMKAAMGDLAGTPLGVSAMSREADEEERAATARH